MVYSDWNKLSVMTRSIKSWMLARVTMPEPDRKDFEQEYEDLLRFEAML
jgi:hypothetical protein